MSAASARKLPAKVETVLFDAGGVLVDLDFSYLRRLVEARSQSASETALARAEALARMEIQRRVSTGSSSAEVWRDYFHLILHEVGVAGGEHGEIIDTLWEAHHRFGLWTVPIPGSVEVVRSLRQRGLRLGVVSNAEGRVAQDLASAGFAGQFDAIIDSHLVGVEKPDPQIFRIALEQLEARADTAVFVGDVPAVDQPGAEAVGISPILLDRHDLYREAEVPRLHSLKELPPLIEGA